VAALGGMAGEAEQRWDSGGKEATRFLEKGVRGFLQNVLGKG
jgi:hypothetical protein